MKKTFLFRIISSALVISTVLSISPIAFSEDNSIYEDVKNYCPYNSWAVETGKKYSLIFLENNRREAKRWEISNLLYNILNLKKSANISDKFTDLENIDKNIKQSINAVADMKIISGYEDGTFKPLENVTRAEFVTMLDRSDIINKKSNSKNNIQFNDIDDHWAKESIERITGLGILYGKDDNNFCPQDNITPQEILVILDRLEKLNFVSFDDVLKSVTDTFKCKKYGEKERYIVEVIYSNFDQVQNDMKHRWPYEDCYYSYNDWQSLVTFNDLFYATYLAYYGSRDFEYYSEMSEQSIASHEDTLLSMGINYAHSNDSQINALNGNMSYVTLKDLLYAMYTMGAYGLLERFTAYESYFDHISFSNSSSLSEYDKHVLQGMVTHDYMLENNDMYFEMNIPVTKFILNYFILKLQDRAHGFPELNISSKITEFFTSFSEDNNHIIKIETDESKLPYNYGFYPYIIKGIPKEAYECEGARVYSMGDYQPDVDQGTGTYYGSPLLCYRSFSGKYRDLIELSNSFYDLILNVDYRTINIDNFVDQISQYSYFIDKDQARQYAQYVIDNQIVLKGSGCAIPGTRSVVGILGYIRVILNFEVISAKEKVDLLYLDFKNTFVDTSGSIPVITLDHVPVIYANDKYLLYFDQQISSDITGKQYRIVHTQPIIRNIYLNNYEQNTLY